MLEMSHSHRSRLISVGDSLTQIKCMSTRARYFLESLWWELVNIRHYHKCACGYNMEGNDKFFHITPAWILMWSDTTGSGNTSMIPDPFPLTQLSSVVIAAYFEEGDEREAYSVISISFSSSNANGWN
ncbi:hypothetical protein KIN20_024034 [Parelaphostrongylus tenuis]|uniref:Uncharacterized protein n=1 Tax=Parelaphostrongylus tenuis TaxID=148309 RepID=A0AAD5MWH3_PARTN|nr:hypothetical protein KIN20_024034 [Parelaphostrongylus tenuis]